MQAIKSLSVHNSLLWLIFQSKHLPRQPHLLLCWGYQVHG